MATALQYGRSIVLRSCYGSALSKQLKAFPVISGSFLRTLKTQASKPGVYRPDFAFAFEFVLPLPWKTPVNFQQASMAS